MDMRPGSEGEVGVVPRVVADEVAGSDDAAHEIGCGVGVAAEKEERDADIVGGEQFEQTRRPDGVGAVIKSEGQLIGFRRGDEGGAKKARAGAERGVGAAAGRQAYPGRGAQAGKHSDGCKSGHALQCDAGSGAPASRDGGAGGVVRVHQGTTGGAAFTGREAYTRVVRAAS